MKKKMYSTTPKKSEDEKSTFKIKIDPTKIPNKMHLDTQIKFSSRTFEDRRKKKPKYKGKLYDEE